VNNSRACNSLAELYGNNRYTDTAYRRIYMVRKSVYRQEEREKYYGN